MSKDKAGKARDGRSRRLAVIQTVLLMTFVSAAFSQPLPSKTDQVLFVCKSGSKEAYLVRRKSNSGKNVGIQYLSISNGRPEFIFPNTPDISGNTFKFSRRGYSGGGEYHITFRNGPYSYIIYDKNTVADNRSLPRMKSGILVLNGQKIVSTRPCKIGAIGNIAPAAKAALKPEPFTQIQGVP